MASGHNKPKASSNRELPPARYDDLRALFLNCTLKRSGEDSHTERLIHVAVGVMRANQVKLQVLRPVDLDLAPGVQPDMRKHGFEHNDWPALSNQVMHADIGAVPDRLGRFAPVPAAQPHPRTVTQNTP